MATTSSTSKEQRSWKYEQKIYKNYLKHEKFILYASLSRHKNIKNVILSDIFVNKNLAKFKCLYQ